MNNLDDRWVRLDSAPVTRAETGSNRWVIVTSKPDRGIYEDLIYNPVSGDIYRRRWWGVKDEAWFKLDRQQPARFGGRLGLTKEEIACDLLHIFEMDDIPNRPGSIHEEEYYFQQVLIEQIVQRMPDEAAQKWADAIQEAEASVLADDSNAEGLHHDFREADLTLLEACGFGDREVEEVPEFNDVNLTDLPLGRNEWGNSGP